MLLIKIKKKNYAKNYLTLKPFRKFNANSDGIFETMPSLIYVQGFSSCELKRIPQSQVLDSSNFATCI